MKNNLITFSKYVAYIIVLISFFIFAACSNKQDHLAKLQKELASIKEQNKPKFKTQKTIFLPTLITYQALTETPKKLDKKIMTLYPLTAYSLQSLQFVGTIIQDNHMWAYIKTPDHMIYQAKEGDKIGNNGAQIQKIAEDHIDILETKQHHVTTLQLKG